jgi:anaerobic selenocysteine-containing dehydrogenase
LEHLDVHTSYGHTYVMFNEPAVAPLGQARSNAQIFRDLAAHLGFEEPCFADSDETLARTAFNASIDFEALRAQGWLKLPLPDAPFAEGNFPTPSGRCIVDARDVGVPDHVPNYESELSSPELAQRYPLAMISPPARNFLNSSFVNLKSLRDIEGEPLLEMHEVDAKVRGIESGHIVRVHNDRGVYQCKAVVSTRARPGVVNGLGVWWRKLGVAGTNVNEVTHQRLTDMGRAPSFYDCLVEVSPLGRTAP